MKSTRIRAGAMIVAMLGGLGVLGVQAVAQEGVGGMGPAAAPVPDQPGYHGHKWVRVTVSTARQLQTVLALSEETLNCSGHGIGTFDVRMAPEQFDAFQQAGITHRVLFDDIQAAVESDMAEIDRRRANPQEFPSWYDNHKTWAEVQAHVQDLATQNSGLATYAPLGLSLQGRTIFAIRITGPGSTTERPAIVFTGTQHAREWASPMTVVYAAEHLITEYATDPQVKSIVDHIEFLIIPFVNPDGYVYTWASPNNRMWRKNMRPAPPPPVNPACFGVDPNRNWGYQWGGIQGASPDPCSETYRGADPFSEPETQVVRDFVIANPRIKGSIDFHSFSQLVMSPWGFTIAVPPDHAFFQMVNAAMSAAIEGVHGASYAYGPGYTTIYPTTGSVKDWMYGARGIFGWTIEVRDAGSYGFIMPPSEILPNAEENYAGVKVHALNIGPKLIFSLPTGAPSNVPAGQANAVQVEIKPGMQPMQPGTARLFYRIGTSGPPITVVMTSVGNGVFQGNLPAADCGTIIQYVFQATTTQGLIAKYPAVGFAQPFQTEALQTTEVFNDDAETQAGWSIGGPGSTATQGIWVRNDPQFTLAQPEDDHTPGAGHFCYVTNHLAGVNVAQHDVDGGSTLLTTPVLSGVVPQPLTDPELWLRYWRWYSNDQGLNPNADSFLVQVSNDSGATWATTVEEVNENPETWVMKEFRVSDLITPTTQMKFRFIASDVGADSVVEACIDDVQLRIVGCPAPFTCYPDCNNSTTLTVADFTCFQAKFVAADPYADCNDSGTLTVADFTCFQGKFVAGCP